MFRKNGKRIFAAVLAAALLLTGCASAPAEQTVEAETVQTAPTETAAVKETVPEGPRYQVEWAKDAVIYEVNVRQYTQEGTFNAFSAHLQTLKDMGINTLWFMPIHPISETKRSGTLGSYYSITDFRAVNPEFGTAEDFKALVDQAHGMGFKVMMDWVANHTGWDCAWIKDHPEWYTQKDGKIIDPEGMGWPDVADLNYDSKEMRAEMIACMKYWVEEFDIDGFRCDYANGVPQGFWEAARTELETVKPMLMLAEDGGTKSLLRYAFDLNYNWDLYETLRGIAGGGSSAYFIRGCIPHNYPDGTYRLNFLDNHDKNSWEYTITEAFGAEALPAMWSLIYTVPGTPLVYSGDEIGLDHKIAFMERDPIDWESTDVDYRPLLKELATIRSENPALYAGNYGGSVTYQDLDRRAIFAFTREVDGNTVQCLFNLTGEVIQTDASKFFGETGTVLLHGQGADVLEMEDYPLSEAGLDGEITLQPWEFWIVQN